MTAIVLVGVVIALLGGWLVYTGYVDPGTTTDRRTVSSWGSHAAFNHTATVQKPNPIYPLGRTLENKSAYIQTVSPELDGSFRFGYQASVGGSLTANATSLLVVRRVERNQETEIELWRRTRLLAGKSASIDPGDTVRVPFSFNVTALNNRSERTAETLGDLPGRTEMTVRTTVVYEGRVNDRSVEGTNTYNLSVLPDEGVYLVSSNLSDERFNTTRTVTVLRDPGILQAGFGALLLVASILLLGTAGGLRYRGDIPLDAAEREWLRYLDDREDFAEWISEATLPSAASDMQTAETESLADLVDLAIDTDNRVIQEPDSRAYYVTHDGWLYTYHPPFSPGSESDGDSPPEEGKTETDEAS